MGSRIGLVLTFASLAFLGLVAGCGSPQRPEDSMNSILEKAKKDQNVTTNDVTSKDKSTKKAEGAKGATTN